ncbi:MAG: hypothetical protein AAB316_14570, partial [Bacteroidota bacterium]
MKKHLTLAFAFLACFSCLTTLHAQCVLLVNGSPVPGSTMCFVSGQTLSVELDTCTNVAYSWTTPSGSSTQATVSVTGGGTYSVTISNTTTMATCCMLSVVVNAVNGGTISNDQIVCSNGDPTLLSITGDSGSGPLSYQWQSSTTDCMTGFTNIATTQTYDPPSNFNQTTYYRRITTSTVSGLGCSDTSDCATILVNSVNPGTISNDQTVCQSGDPTVLSISGSSGSGALSYQWQSNTVSCMGVFANIANATGQMYDPPAGLSQTTFYRRVTTSTLNGVACPEESDCATVFINSVNPGLISPDQAICAGGDPGLLSISSSGGSGTLSYQWQSNTISCMGVFSNISNATSNTYDPPAGLNLTTHYRRVTTSVFNGTTCSDESDCATVSINSVNPGTISADQTICPGGDPGALSISGSTGSGSLSYQWQSNTTSCMGVFANISNATGQSYDPPAGLNQTTYYRRVTTSNLNGTTCSDESDCATVSINSVNPGTISADQTICPGGDPGALSISGSTGSGSLSYQWQSNTTSCMGVFANISGATSQTYDPPAGLSQTTYYRRVTTSTLSGVSCSDESDCATVFVNSVTPGVISNDQTVCGGGAPTTLNVMGSTGSGNLSYQWQSNTTGCMGVFANISGAISQTYDPPAGLSQTTYYRRVTTSTLNGVPCSDESDCATVFINNVDGGAVSSDQAICSGGDPVAFSNATSGSGSGNLSFQWQSNTTSCGGTFSNISGATSPTYDPPAGLSQTTYYRRV